jgi:hypothetical protein
MTAIEEAELCAAVDVCGQTMTMLFLRLLVMEQANDV